jgi:chromosome segregation ATPase
MALLTLLWQIATLGFSARRASLKNQVAFNDSVGKHLERLERALDEEIDRGRERDAEIAKLRGSISTLQGENGELRQKLAECEDRHHCDVATIRELTEKLESNNQKIVELERRLHELTNGGS